MREITAKISVDGISTIHLYLTDKEYTIFKKLTSEEKLAYLIDFGDLSDVNGIKQIKCINTRKYNDPN
jgi:acetylglutamate kinase